MLLKPAHEARLVSVSPAPVWAPAAAQEARWHRRPPCPHGVQLRLGRTDKDQPRARRAQRRVVGRVKGASGAGKGTGRAGQGGRFQRGPEEVVFEQRPNIGGSELGLPGSRAPGPGAQNHGLESRDPSAGSRAGPGGQEPRAGGQGADCMALHAGPLEVCEPAT